MDPVPSHRWPARFAKIASLAPDFAASASATTFSAYDVDLTPASAPRSLRGHGTRTTAVVSGAGSIGGRDHDQGRRDLSPARPERRRPTRVGDPDPSQRQVLLGQHLGHRGPDELVVRLGQTERGGRARQPGQVARQRERLAVDDLDRLEHAVPDGEAVIGHPDRGSVRILEQLAVHPSVHAPEVNPR